MGWLYLLLDRIQLICIKINDVRDFTEDEYRTYIATFKKTYQKEKFQMGSPYNGKLIFYMEDSSPLSS